jgi:hypothetical protein
MRKRWEAAVSHRELTTVVTPHNDDDSRLPDAFPYTTIELVSSLVVPSACDYGSEGWGSNPFARRYVSE